MVRETGKIVENNQYGDYKYQSFVNEVDELKEKIFRLISYPIGISLANVYDNFTVEEKKEYLSFISKFLLNIKHIDLEMILESFNISLNSDFYIKNFEEYVQKFNDVNNKFLVLGGRK